MRQTLEREVKLQAPPGFGLPTFPGTPIETRRFTSTYYDTEDLRLAAHGITIRRRVENRKSRWQLKIPQGDARLEIEEPGGPTAPPRSLTALLVASLRGSKLQPVAKLRTERSGVTVSEELRPVAEVVLDAVQALDGNRIIDRFTEIEVELVDGTERDLSSLVAILKSHGAFTGDTRPKVLQIIDYRPPRLFENRTTDLAHVQGFIYEQFDAIVAHDAGTRVGSDPEDLHQQRVAIRKLRSLLRSADMLDPEWAASLGTELEWIGDALNPVRDLDVMIPYLAEDAKHLPAEDSFVLKPFLAHLRAQRDESRQKMVDALQSERYFDLLRVLDEATQAIKVRPTESDLKTAAADRFRKLRKAVRSLPDPPEDEELHRVRRLAKKARYAAEVILPAQGKPVRAFMKRMKLMQEVLGDFQDACVAEDRIRSYLSHAESTHVAFALGRLAELQARKKREAHARFPAVWKEVSRTGKRAWLD